LPKSPEGQAISYTLSNWEALIRYCEDGDLEIDNNGAERSLRGVAVGRLPAPGREELALLRKRYRRANRGHPRQLHHHLQTASHRPLRLPPRHLPAHQRPFSQTPRRTPPRPLESRSKRHPQPRLLIPREPPRVPTPCLPDGYSSVARAFSRVPARFCVIFPPLSFRLRPVIVHRLKIVDARTEALVAVSIYDRADGVSISPVVVRVLLVQSFPYGSVYLLRSA